eukprot:COSAG05_NODE_228_length_13388_cov_2.850403_6_plen_126_part_00
MDALVNQGDSYAARSWSICGNNRAVQGAIPPSLVDKNNGVETYTYFSELGEQFLSMSEMQHTSLFGETFAGLLQFALESTEYLKPIIDEAQLSNPNHNGWSSQIGKQFAQGTHSCSACTLPLCLP